MENEVSQIAEAVEETPEEVSPGRAMRVAAGLARLALVAAEKDVMFEVAHQVPPWGPEL